MHALLRSNLTQCEANTQECKKLISNECAGCNSQDFWGNTWAETPNIDTTFGTCVTLTV
jgi:hypothetical protein